MLNLPIASLVVVLLSGAAGSVGATSASSPAAVSAVPVGLSVDPRVQRQWISAIGNDKVDTLRRMLSRHEPGQLIELAAGNGKNALMVASKKGDMPLVQSLVDAGLGIDDTTQTNGTAFMFAVLGNQKAIAEWLLASGADMHVVGSNGWTALTLAAAKGHARLLRWLIDHGADTQVRDVYRFTPFMRAVENGHISVVKMLLALPETDIDAQDEYDNTALHHAVSSGDISMVRLLLRQGAAVDISNRKGVTARALAVDNPVMQALFP